MKTRVSMVAAGLIAGAALWAVGAQSPEVSIASEPKASSWVDGKTQKFDIPCWHPDARWAAATNRPTGAVRRAETVSPGVLDGPDGETLWSGAGACPSLCGRMSTGGRFSFMSYDEKINRYHSVTLGAAGQFDGPFSRARFLVDEYVPRQNVNEYQSPDKRYVYLISGNWGEARVRCLDFEKQWVSTVPVGKGPPLAIAVDGKGLLYVVTRQKELLVMDPAQQWKVLSTVTLQDWDKEAAFSGCSAAIAVDEVNGRVYGNTSAKWHLWYWSIKDGSHHGLIKRVVGWPELKGEQVRGRGVAGPFKGAVFYAEGTLGWGPDDPKKRFIYMACCDDDAFYRLDLEKEMVAVFLPKEGRFVESGNGGRTTYFLQPFWWGNGSFNGFERVK